MPTKILTEWFDRLETMLSTEAELAGLLNHGSTVGQAREFLIARVLRTILPPGVHIGSGLVIDAYGNTSRQIDVIVYDPRFPLLRVDGGGLYFVEGVLATIEVKSTIDSDELATSLENCKSVLTLGIHGEHHEEAEARIAFYSKTEGITPEEGEERFRYKIHPSTYIFSFCSKLSTETTTRQIKDWWQRNNCAHSAQFPLLPRVITTGNSVGIVNDGRFTVHRAGAGVSDASGDAGGEGRCHVMTVFSTCLRFRWLALHIMDAASSRLGLRNFAENFDYRISSYFPMDGYLESIKEVATYFIERKNNKQ